MFPQYKIETSMRNNNQRKRTPKSITSPIEAIKDLGNDLKDSVANDLVGGVASDAIRQILGPTQEKTGVKEKAFPERAERKQPIYIIKERPLYIEENKVEITHRTNLILTEIRNIAKETKGLEKQLGDFSLEEAPESPGTYFLSFFGRILEVLREARQKIHEAATWLAVWQTRRRKRGLLAGYGYGAGRKSTTAAIHKMLGSEMGASRSGA